MGKEWYRSSKRSGGGVAEGAETQATPSAGCMCAVFQFFDNFHPFHLATTINHHQQQQETPFKSAPSCIIPEDYTTTTTTIPKGAEAPRNSLESEDGTTTFSSLSKEEDFKIPKNIQIKTSGGNSNDLSSDSPGTKTPTLVARLMGLDLLPDAAPSPSFSSCLSTPNPHNSTIPQMHHHLRQHIQTKPRNSRDSSIDNNIAFAATTRSLPETPRISSARKSDVEHHRLSLQINNKENNMMMMSLIGEEYLEVPHRFSFSKTRKYCDHENNYNSCKSNTSPSHYARQIVKQVKESVMSRRVVGQDITNNNNNTLKSREELFRVKNKSPKKTSLKALDESSSCSPRLRFIDTNNKHKPNTTTTQKDQNTHPNVLKLPPTPSLPHTQQQFPRVLITKPKAEELTEQKVLSREQKLVTKCKKGATTNEKFSSSRLKRPPQTTDIIRNKQEESFVVVRPTSSSPTRGNEFKTTKSKKTQPLSSNLINNINSNVPNPLPVKTDPSPPATKIPQKQPQVSDTQESKFSSQLSSCWRQRYKQEGTTSTVLATQEISTITEDKPNGAYTTVASTATATTEYHKPEFQYITEILNRTNSLNKQGSTTHPLDPSIFHHLELHHNDKDRNFTPKNQLGHRWNRRLLFDLVGEVLKEILRPKGCEKKPWFLHGFCYQGGSINGELAERVWKRVGEFPCAKCEVLDDIDVLIEAEDMEKVQVEGEEEGERLVAEIEGKIWDTLVHETVMVMDFGGKNDF